MRKPALQKAFVLLLMIVLPVFIIKKHKIFRDRTAYTSTYKMNHQAHIQDKHFAVLIPINTVTAKLENNLKHLLSQKYSNYEVIFINIEESNQLKNEIETSFANIKNTLEKEGHTKFPSYFISNSYFESIHSLKDDDIVLHLESSDWLAREDVFEKIATVFANTDVWLAYSTYLDFPSYEHRFEHYQKDEKWWKLHNKKSEWLTSPLKLFYAGLFKEVKFSSSSPKHLKPRLQLNVYLIPMVENAKKHITYIKDILYVHDTGTPSINTDILIHN
ncbi:MAG: hypothetical protein K9M07_02895 [Simkaniaceae bacterium]|nr:hypothetical protein [Simkaniaceae bacterium]